MGQGSPKPNGGKKAQKDGGLGQTQVPWGAQAWPGGLRPHAKWQWRFSPQTGGGIRRQLEARPEGRGVGWGPQPQDPQSGTYRTWSGSSTRASWSRRRRAGSRSRRPSCTARAASACTPPPAPRPRAGTGTACLRPPDTDGGSPTGLSQAPGTQTLPSPPLGAAGLAALLRRVLVVGSEQSSAFVPRTARLVGIGPWRRLRGR